MHSKNGHTEDRVICSSTPHYVPTHYRQLHGAVNYHDNMYTSGNTTTKCINKCSGSRVSLITELGYGMEWWSAK